MTTTYIRCVVRDNILNIEIGEKEVCCWFRGPFLDEKGLGKMDGPMGNVFAAMLLATTEDERKSACAYLIDAGRATWKALLTGDVSEKDAELFCIKAEGATMVRLRGRP